MGLKCLDLCQEHRQFVCDSDEEGTESEHLYVIVKDVNVEISHAFFFRCQVVVTNPLALADLQGSF